VTIIAYNIPEAGKDILTVYSIAGRKAATLVSGHQEPGRYRVTWDGSRFALGSSLYPLEAGNFTKTRKAQLVR
jgi:hypothetical protein